MILTAEQADQVLNGRKHVTALTEPDLHHLADQALEAWPDDGWAFTYRAMTALTGACS